MTQHHYYELFGVTRKAVLDLMATTDERRNQGLLLAKELGAKTFVRGFAFGIEDISGFVFESEPSKINWKQSKDKSFWIPRHSTKEGKALHQRMRAIKLIGGGEFAKLLGMEVVKGCRVRTPGVDVIGNRVVVTVPDDVVLKVDAKRISDIQFERMKAKKRSVTHA